MVNEKTGHDSTSLEIEMSTERKGKKKSISGIIRVVFIAAIVCLVNPIMNAQESEPDALTNGVFALNNISPAKAIGYLRSLEIGQAVNQVGKANAIIISGSPEEIRKAQTLLNLVDAEFDFQIRLISTEPQPPVLPSYKELRSKIGDMVVVNFGDPPVRSTPDTALIDLHKNKIMIVTTSGYIDRTVEAVKDNQPKPETGILFGPAVPGSASEPNLSEPEMVTEKPEPNEVTEPSEAEKVSEEDELFTDLIAKLQSVEKQAEPNEPAEPHIAEQGQAAIEETEEGFAIITPRIDERAVDGSQEKPQSRPGSLEEIINGEDAELDKSEMDAQLESLMQALGQGKPKDVSEEQFIIPPSDLKTEQEPEPTEQLDEPNFELGEVDVPNGDHVLELAMPEQVEIIALIELVGKYLQLDYLYDPKEVGGTVTMEIQGPIRIKDLYSLLESVLQFKGLGMTRRGNLVTIVPAAKIIDYDPEIVTSPGDVEAGNVIVTSVFNLDDISPTAVENLLKQLRLGKAYVKVDETNSIIITEYAYRMQRIKDLIDMIDLPGDPRMIKFRKLQYTQASSLIRKVEALAKELGTVSIDVGKQARPTPSRQPRRRGRPAPKQATSTPDTQQPALYLDADPRTNRILMIGTSDEIAVVENLIEALDVEQQDIRSIKHYEIMNIDAEDVQKKLSELGMVSASAMQGPTPARRPARQGQPAAGGTETPQDIEEDLAQAIVLESTNSLLVNGTPRQHAEIATILAYVDRARSEASIPYVVYPLENQDPEDLVETLQKVVQETIQDPQSKVQKTVKKEEDVTIVADPGTFSIIVYASKRNQEWIGNLIRTLDKRRPQVLIDVMLVEISQTDNFEYDLDLVTSWPDLTNTSGLLNAIAGTTSEDVLSDLAAAGDRSRFMDASVDSGTGKGFYADKHIQALITLMQSKGYGRVLAHPKLLVNDAEEGTIDAQNTTYVARTGTVRSDQSDNITTTTEFNDYTSGIQLTIMPHISEGDLLRLEITMSRSNQGSASGETNAPPPDKTENNINTIVTVPDQSTIILGGIHQLNQNKDNTKVPVLGDVPLVGGLFRSVNNTSSQTKLYIFVKAQILRPAENLRGLPALERASKLNREAFEQAERKFQIYESWPGVKPEPMDPEKVLDAK